MRSRDLEMRVRSVSASYCGASYRLLSPQDIIAGIVSVSVPAARGAGDAAARRLSLRVAAGATSSSRVVWSASSPLLGPEVFATSDVAMPSTALLYASGGHGVYYKMGRLRDLKPDPSQSVSWFLDKEADLDGSSSAVGGAPPRRCDSQRTLNAVAILL